MVFTFKSVLNNVVCTEKKGKKCFYFSKTFYSGAPAKKVLEIVKALYKCSGKSTLTKSGWQMVQNLSTVQGKNVNLGGGRRSKGPNSCQRNL